jgi:hypothetical protein
VKHNWITVPKYGACNLGAAVWHVFKYPSLLCELLKHITKIGTVPLKRLEKKCV